MGWCCWRVKTELIRLDDLGANTVQNQSRQLFGKAPGISVWESDGSGMQIGVGSRGLSPNRSWEFNVRQNGYDIAADPFGYPGPTTRPPGGESITLVRGAAGLQYGPQFGGLLDRIRQAPADPQVGRRKPAERRQLRPGSFNALGGTVGRLSYFAFYHHRQAEGWREQVATVPMCCTAPSATASPESGRRISPTPAAPTACSKPAASPTRSSPPTPAEPARATGSPRPGTSSPAPCSTIPIR